MILVIDNYDSFVYNLVQYFGELVKKGFESGRGGIKVFRNDKIGVDKIRKIAPSYIIISPGPCTPKEAGVSVDAIKEFAGKIPILGVCLGHQSIVYAFGGNIVRAGRPMHGKTSLIYNDGKTIFNGLSNPFEATRYHSLLAERKTLPACLQVSAWTSKNEIMGVRLKDSEVPVEGVQFHPESILTAEGKKLLQNFLNWRKLR